MLVVPVVSRTAPWAARAVGRMPYGGLSVDKWKAERRQDAALEAQVTQNVDDTALGVSEYMPFVHDAVEEWGLAWA